MIAGLCVLASFILGYIVGWVKAKEDCEKNHKDSNKPRINYRG